MDSAAAGHVGDMGSLQTAAEAETSNLVGGDDVQLPCWIQVRRVFQHPSHRKLQAMHWPKRSRLRSRCTDSLFRVVNKVSMMHGLPCTHHCAIRRPGRYGIAVTSSGPSHQME